MITVTDRALNKLLSLRDSEDKALRVSVTGGGCSGMSYKLDWITMGDTTIADKVITINGMSVAIDPKSALFIKGIELDYDDGLNGQGFTFNNPNATKSCGCGSSFSV